MPQKKTANWKMKACGRIASCVPPLPMHGAENTEYRIAQRDTGAVRSNRDWT